LPTLAEGGRGDAETEGAEREMERRETKKEEPAEQQAEDRLSSTTARWKENKPRRAALAVWGILISHQVGLIAVLRKALCSTTGPQH